MNCFSKIAPPINSNDFSTTPLALLHPFELEFEFEFEFEFESDSDFPSELEDVLILIGEEQYLSYSD